MLYVLMNIIAFIAIWLDGDTSSAEDGVARQSIVVEDPKKVYHLIGDFHVPDPLETFGFIVGLGFGTNELVGTSASETPTINGGMMKSSSSRPLDVGIQSLSIGQPPISPKRPMFLLVNDPKGGLLVSDLASGDTFPGPGNHMLEELGSRPIGKDTDRGKRDTRHDQVGEIGREIEEVEVLSYERPFNFVECFLQVNFDDHIALSPFILENAEEDELKDDGLPKFLIEKGMKTIKSRSFGSLKSEDNFLDLKDSGDTVQHLMGSIRDGAPRGRVFLASQVVEGLIRINPILPPHVKSSSVKKTSDGIPFCELTYSGLESLEVMLRQLVPKNFPIITIGASIDNTKKPRARTSLYLDNNMDALRGNRDVIAIKNIIFPHQDNSTRFRDVYGRFTLTINVKGFIEVLNIPPVSTLGSLISIVNLVKFHGSRIIHISLTNSANLKVIGLSRVVTSVTRTFMVAKIDCIYGLLALNIFIVFYLSQVSGVRAIGWVTSTREDIFSSYRRVDIHRLFYSLPDSGLGLPSQGMQGLGETFRYISQRPKMGSVVTKLDFLGSCSTFEVTIPHYVTQSATPCTQYSLSFIANWLIVAEGGPLPSGCCSYQVDLVAESKGRVTVMMVVIDGGGCCCDVTLLDVSSLRTLLSVNTLSEVIFKHTFPVPSTFAVAEFAM
ncbi:hypothetical protein FXO37_14549 [Capsicum annuum]|nr:hypothetical protein FXO37_14549 [Capsicum annuum]